jgi:hypothetical protein
LPKKNQTKNQNQKIARSRTNHSRPSPPHPHTHTHTHTHGIFASYRRQRRRRRLPRKSAAMEVEVERERREWRSSIWTTPSSTRTVAGKDRGDGDGPPGLRVHERRGTSRHSHVESHCARPTTVYSRRTYSNHLQTTPGRVTLLRRTMRLWWRGRGQGCFERESGGGERVTRARARELTRVSLAPGTGCSTR